MGNKLTVLLPPASQCPAIPGFKPKALWTLLSRAKSFALGFDTIEEYYMHLFSVKRMRAHNNLPMVAIEAAGLELANSYPHWLRADPVHIVTDHTNAYITDIVQLADDEITQLLLDINELLIANGYFLHAPKVDAWYLNVPTLPAITTKPVAEMLGRPVMEGLPTGQDEVEWRRLFTELQMLLYTHPVNQQRRQQRLPTVDGLWFWGQGSLPSKVHHDWTQVWSNSLLMQGLCYLADTQCEPVPSSAEDCLSYVSLDGKFVLSLEHLTSIQTIETQWMQPLLEVLRDKKITMMQFVRDGKIYSTNPDLVKHWWRRVKAV
jgi:hypothetical protein